MIDLDISRFFDTIDHDLLSKALDRHTSIQWIQLYIDRWLVSPYQRADGSQVDRSQGVPQGSVIGPLLANLFLHYAFDEWMKRTYPEVPFERYADDVVCHCATQWKAQDVLASIDQRLKACRLSLNSDKTRIVYCKDSNRKQEWPVIQFDFLGHTFRPRPVKSQLGVYFTGFNPAMSSKAQHRICEVIRSWDINQWVGWGLNLKDIAAKINPVLRGWINYYGKFYPSMLRKHLRFVDLRLASWVRVKFKRFRRHKTSSIYWLGAIAKRSPGLFAHWQWGYKPPVEKGFSMG